MPKLYGTDLDITKYKFDYDSPIENQNYIITYRDPENPDDEYGVAGPGDIVFINGREKSRKSAFMSGMIAGAFTNIPLADKSTGEELIPVDDFHINFGFDIKLSENGVIAVFDTEHSINQFKISQRKFHRRVGFGGNDKRYNAYSIREFDPVDRLTFIDKICKGIVASGHKLDVIVHDQCGDLVRDVNETYSVAEYEDFLMKMTEEYGCVAIPVLHTNRGGVESLGKLGAKLDKKMTSGWLVEYDQDTKISCARNTRARNLPIYKKICFHHNVEGHIELVKDDLNL